METCACIVLEVLKALEELKRNREVHCDIKPGKYSTIEALSRAKSSFAISGFLS